MPLSQGGVRASVSVLLCLISVVLCPASQLSTRGLWAQFERRGWASEYWPGQVIQQFNNFDSVVGHTVSAEVALQLDAMRGMGVNTITIELRTADTDGNSAFPTCHVSPPLGSHWPQPTATELANLPLLFNLVQSKGMKIILVLTNTHMEQLPRTNSQTWLRAILNVVKNHAALDYVVFNGDAHTIDTDGDGIPDACGGQAEPGLWMGSTNYAATYVSWAIGYAMSLGVPAIKLSAGTIVGDFFTESQPPNAFATDGHLWSPIVVMKAIFDSLGIPNNQRLYALSFYEHAKCATARGLPCVEASPPMWAEQTVQGVFSRIGSGARLVAYEMGDSTPVQPTWTTSQAIQNLVGLMAKYGIDGGSFWRWTSFNNSEDQDPALAQPIKLRGVGFNYTSAKTILECYYTGACLLPSVVKPATYIASNSFTANWRNVSGATGYRLDVSANSSFTSYVAGYQNLDVGNTTNRNVTGLNASTTYHYRVRAYNGAGTSGNSNVVNVTTLSATGPPVVITNPATLIASFSATLNASVDPHGLTTSVYFQYGTTASYGHTTATQTQAGNTYRNVIANISGLSASTTYHFRIVATNSAGTTYGSDRTFTMLSATGPPVVTTNPATFVASFSATLNGSLDPHGLTTTVYFQYGTTTSYGLTTAPQSQTGNTFRNVSANISGLSASTTYHFRIVATNSAGTTYGADRTFATLSPTGPPVVITNAAANVASSSATLNGTVDPHGLITTVYFQYGTTTSYGSTTASQTKTGNTYQNVSANISGLIASTTYHFRIVATNSAGTTHGSDRAFTTP